LSLAFFPKLLQGPIERSGDLLPQLKIKFAPDYDNLRAGGLLFTWGLFKKLVIADRLGIYVDAVYNSVHQFTGLALLLATYAYAFQIYLDFSGYTDMALGSARLFNINLTQNFNSPYLATSVADFWRRWHISFSSWILDYMFKPLQMRWRHAKNWGTAAALLVTFLISGIWHGASWKFVLWGLLHGVYLAGSVFYRPFRNKLQKRWGIRDHRLGKAGRIFVTFNLICLAWVLFRANNLADAWYVLSHLFHGTKSALSGLLRPLGNLDAVILAVSALVYLTIGSLIKRHGLSSFNKLPLYQKCLIFYSLSMAIVIFGVFDRAGFLYFIF
jgi:D-alanyl-lipoteichoic acid acyltransferase DltB (MBOAT superfamily)